MIKITEEWKPINGWDGYEISNYGKVYSHKTNKLLTLRTNHKGYTLAWLSKENKLKGFLVHRLVFEAFVCPIPTGMQINHLDENKQNNMLDNLALVTQSENIRYGSALERSWKTKKEKYGDSWSKQLRKPCINETTGMKYASVSEAARQTGLERSSISNACSKKRKTYKGQIWSYL